MPDRNAQLKVVISGDTSGLNRATRDASRSLDRLGKDTSLHARISSRGFSSVGLAAQGMAAGIGAAVAGGAFLIQKFEDSNKIAKQTNAVLKSTGGQAHVTAKEITALATALSRKSGVDDESVQSSENVLLTFRQVHNEAGRGNKIFNGATRAALDMSVALGRDLTSTSLQVGKALNDPLKGMTALSRAGVQFTEQQKDQIKTMVASGNTLGAQKVILGELNKEFAGSARAQATPFAKLKVSAENLAETLGGHLAPIVGKAAAWLNKFLNQMQDGTGAGGRFARRMSQVADAVKQFINEVVIPLVRKLAPVFNLAFNNMVSTLRDVTKIISGVLTGNWSKAWDGLKDIVVRLGKNLVLVLKTMVPRLLNAAKNIGLGIVKGIISGLSGLAGALANKVKSAVSSIPGAISGAAKSVGKALISPFGDGVGQAWASSQLPVGVTGGAFSGSLMGARPVMGTFAREGARFGLGVSSGRRAGSITSSGNLSWHSTGEAIDLSNGYATPQELAYAKYEAAHHGGQLAELIHTPLGFGIKDGRRVPLSFWGPTINAQHMNHVHVAYDSGKPGIGDGIGQIENLWMQAGGPRSKAAVAAAVAEAESSGNPGASNRNSDGSIDRGLWQINSVHGSLSTFDRMGNARAAVRISSGGSNWRPWTTYVSGAYRRFLAPAQAALAGVKGKGGGGAPVSKPKGTAFGKVTGTLTPAGSYGAQIVGVSDNGGPIKSTSPGLTGKYSDVVDAQEALATLTSSTADDLRVANIRVHDARVALRKAKKTHNAKKIAKAAGALRSALDTRNSLKSSADTGGEDGGGVDNSALIDAINANTEAQQAAQAAAEAAAELERQRIDLETQMVANQNKLILLQNTQGPQLLSAVIAAVNGGIGGKIGLGYQSVGFAGQVART